MATDGAGKHVLWLKPDVTLIESGQVRFILDSKWKRIDPGARNYGVSQADAYQLFAYGKRYGCRRVVLLYPKTAVFHETVQFRFADNDLALACFPFDVAAPEAAVSTLMRELLG